MVAIYRQLMLSDISLFTSQPRSRFYKQLFDTLDLSSIKEITADIADSTVALDILAKTNSFLSLFECTFIADKGYDTKSIYNTVKDNL